MGISGQRVNSPFVAPMSKDYPVPPVPLKSSGALFNIAATKLGLTVVPGPLAIITRPYMGRAACVNCGICSGYRLPRARAVELGGHGAAARAENGQMRDPREQLRARDFGRQQRPGHRRRLLRRPEARDSAARESGRAVGERHGVGAAAAALEVGRNSRTASRTRTASSASI